MTDLWDYDLLCKVLVIGDSGCGKSQILLKYSDDLFMESHCATIGIDFKLKTEVVQGKSVRLQIWDTAGQERFRTITRTYYTGANGCLLVYDVTNRDSYENVASWIQEVKNYAPPNAVMMLIGNKCDLKYKRQVSQEEGAHLAKENGMQFVETSAKTGENIDSSFLQIINQMLDNKTYLKTKLDNDSTSDGTVTLPQPKRNRTTGFQCCSTN